MDCRVVRTDPSDDELLQIAEPFFESTGGEDGQVVRMKGVRIADQIAGVEEFMVIGELFNEYVQLRERLFVHELLQIFAGGSQHEHVLVAQIVTDQVQKQFG